MSELEKIFLTSAFTIGGGVIVFVVGQLLSKFMIEPVHELRKAIGQVRFDLAYHAAVIHTPAGRTEERSRAAKAALLTNSCSLIVAAQSVPAYAAVRGLFLGKLPSRKAVDDAAVELRGLSTYVHNTGDRALEDIDVINARVARIEKLLGLRPLD